MAGFNDPPVLLAQFNGDISLLPRRSPFLGHYVPPRCLDCASGRALYVSSLPNGILGGTVRDRAVRRDILFIELLDAPIIFHHTTTNIDATVPASFWWFDVLLQRFRDAPLYSRLDTMQSIALTAYARPRVDNPERPCVHQLLGWTFCCEPSLFTSAWCSRQCARRRDRPRLHFLSC